MEKQKKICKKASKNIIRKPQSTSINPNSVKPVFSLQCENRDYCLDNCNKDETAAFANKIHKLCGLTWNEIYRSPRHGLGFEKIAQNSIKAPIPSSVSVDTKLIAFRFSGKAPMVGFRRGNEFVILWFDPNYTLYNH